MNPVPSRTVKAWVVTDKLGRPLLNTMRPTRIRAIIAYAQTSDLAKWRHYASEFGVQVVRCSITTEPATPATEERTDEHR